MRVGFACKIVRPDGSPSKRYAFRSINRAQFRACDGRKAQRKKIAEIVFHNLSVMNALVARFEYLPTIQRMFRMSNDLVPLLDLPEAQHVYGDQVFRSDLENALGAVGRRARGAGVRLSTHPDQFIIPNSRKPDVAATGVAYVEKWADIAMMMGYRGRGVDDFCINVHLGPRYDSVRDLIRSWSDVKRAMGSGAFALMTVENNDTTWSALDLMRVCESFDIRAVIDVHHNWCVTGEHAEANNKIVRRIHDTWAGRRPKMHFSVPKPDVAGLTYLADGALYDVPLLELARVKGPTRPHADFLWSTSQVAYLKTFISRFDVMLELKMKNLAAERAINLMEVPDD